MASSGGRRPRFRAAAETAEARRVPTPDAAATGRSAAAANSRPWMAPTTAARATLKKGGIPDSVLGLRARAARVPEGRLERARHTPGDSRTRGDLVRVPGTFGCDRRRPRLAGAEAGRARCRARPARTPELSPRLAGDFLFKRKRSVVAVRVKRRPGQSEAWSRLVSSVVGVSVGCRCGQCEVSVRSGCRGL